MERIKQLARIGTVAHTTFPGRSYGTAPIHIEHTSH
jgi:hypothetical protein